MVMSYKSAWERSQDDNTKPSGKSYGKCNLKITLVDVQKILEHVRKTDAEKRLAEHEIVKEKIEQVILLESKNKQGLTQWQLQDMFDDMGFNFNIFFSWTRYADLTAIYNIGGYMIPFYKQLVNLIIGKKSKLYKLFMHKISWGKGRLHLRFYDNGSGGWYIASHVDEVNWLNIFAARKVKEKHSKEGGEGDYETGNYVVCEMLKKLKKTIEGNTIFEIDVDEVIKEFRESRC